jgi:outer membrane protein assembly factor BamA
VDFGTSIFKFTPLILGNVWTGAGSLSSDSINDTTVTEILEYRDTTVILIDNQYGGSFGLQYPFSTYSRLQLDLTATMIVRDSTVTEKIYQRKTEIKQSTTGTDTTSPEYSQLPDRITPFRSQKKAFLPELSIVSDNTLWGRHGPVNGKRMRLSFLLCPPVEQINDFAFTSVMADARKYFHFKKKYSLALRLAGGISTPLREGEKSPQRFYLGASTDELINLFFYRIYGISIEDVYFSRYIAPLRGYDFDETDGGDRFFLANIEFRSPFMRDITLDWPLRFSITNIHFAFFTDIGGAWNRGHAFDVLDRLPDDEQDNSIFSYKYKDLMQGIGYGFRVRLGYFVLRYDIAWKFNLARFSRPYSYLSLGAEF